MYLYSEEDNEEITLSLETLAKRGHSGGKQPERSLVAHRYRTQVNERQDMQVWQRLQNIQIIKKRRKHWTKYTVRDSLY